MSIYSLAGRRYLSFKYNFRSTNFSDLATTDHNLNDWNLLFYKVYEKGDNFCFRYTYAENISEDDKQQGRVCSFFLCSCVSAYVATNLNHVNKSLNCCVWETLVISRLRF